MYEVAGGRIVSEDRFAVEFIHALDPLEFISRVFCHAGDHILVVFLHSEIKHPQPLFRQSATVSPRRGDQVRVFVGDGLPKVWRFVDELTPREDVGVADGDLRIIELRQTDGFR